MAALLHSSDSREPDGTGVAAHAAGKHATGSPLADVGNRYRLIKSLGGTPGDVLYLARHLKSGALVEVRVFTDEHGVSDGLVTALRRLAVDAAAVSEECPGIAALLESITGQEVFDPTIYYFQEIPTIVSPVTVGWIVSGAMMIAVLASILPALRAARMHPVEALRYE